MPRAAEHARVASAALAMERNVCTAQVALEALHACSAPNAACRPTSQWRSSSAPNQTMRPSGLVTWLAVGVIIARRSSPSPKSTALLFASHADLEGRSVAVMATDCPLELRRTRRRDPQLALRSRRRRFKHDRHRPEATGSPTAFCPQPLMPGSAPRRADVNPPSSSPVRRPPHCMVSRLTRATRPPTRQSA